MIPSSVFLVFSPSKPHAVNDSNLPLNPQRDVKGLPSLDYYL